MFETRPLALTLKASDLNKMNPDALNNIIVITTDCDDLSVMSLRDIIDEGGWEGASPSAILEMWLDECSGNSHQIVVVYGSGGWTRTSIEPG